MSILSISNIENVAVITLDAPSSSVNTLNEELMEEFAGLLDHIESSEDIHGAVLVSGKDHNFIAGADIEMFKARETAEEIEQLSRDGHTILNRIESFPKPIVVGIHGSCMGGGVELSLACHYRIASNHSKTVLSLPEVKLGLLPGTGGTQRFPRLVGIQKSLSYMLTGKNIFARSAHKIGLVDELVHKDILVDVGIKAVENIRAGKFTRKPKLSFTEKVLEGNPIGRSIIFSQARKKTLAQTRGNYPAPLKIIEAVEYGFKHGVAKGLQNESKLFGELGATTESRALVELFFAMTGAKNNPQKELVRPVKNIGVLGAGLMGSGIADVSINKGNFQVILKDRDLEAAAKGEQTIYDDLQKKVKKRIITTSDRDQTMSRMVSTDSYEGFHKTDLVIEAVFEDLNLKHTIIKEVEAHTHPDTIFASNTSSLPISDIAKGAQNPELVIGMHYFSPVQKMPLLEIIKTEHTADWVTATAYDVGVKQGKTVIVVNDGPGFYTTRILAPYMNEALLLLEEGASIPFLDKIMKDFGYPVGPMALLDEVGIDVGAHVGETMSPMFNARGAKSSTKAAELKEAGYLGRKNKKGLYLYEEGKKKQVNTEIYSFFGGSNRTEPDTHTTQMRMALCMVNEATYCLQENILLSAKDGDLGAILGLGFPPFTGGPFRYLDTFGIQRAVELLTQYQEEFGPRFKPSDLLLEYAHSNKTFY
jgi:3-hydroxyacyl-CoA dehydrogenase/enoyl-CoA hydratase/3-hydroxybutyryl-CoA epimerase